MRPGEHKIEIALNPDPLKKYYNYALEHSLEGGLKKTIPYMKINLKVWNKILDYVQVLWLNYLIFTKLYLMFNYWTFLKLWKNAQRRRVRSSKNYRKSDINQRNCQWIEFQFG